MAAATARVLRSLPPAREPDAQAPASVRVFGGGTRAPLLLDALARRTGLRVERGPVEAAALGNALVQAVALGRFASVDEARATLVAEEDQ
jgi:rhamnulokinase